MVGWGRRRETDACASVLAGLFGVGVGSRAAGEAMADGLADVPLAFFGEPPEGRGGDFGGGWSVGRREDGDEKALFYVLPRTTTRMATTMMAAIALLERAKSPFAVPAAPASLASWG